MLKRMMGLFLSLMILVSVTACTTVDNVPVTEQNQTTQNEEVSDIEQEKVAQDEEVLGDEKVQVVLFDEEVGVPYVDTISVNGSILVGRGADCNIIISGDDYISRKHCQLAYSDGKIYLSDIGSTNGTFVLVDEQWIAISETVELKIGEQFKIADRLLTLQSVDSVE